MMLLTRFSFLLLVLSRFSLAQDSALTAAVEALPTCAQKCLVTGVVASTCAPTNATCICTNAGLLSSVHGCVLTTCTLKEGLTTQNITQTTCGAPVRSEQKTIKVTNIVMGVTSAACVIARIVYKTFFSVAELGWDDYLIIATLLVGVPQTIITDLGTLSNGLGRDIWTVPFDNITEFSRWFYVMEILYFLILTLLKLSFLVFFLRIFPAKNVKIIIQATILFTALWGISSVLAAVFQCWPISYNWERWDEEHHGKCLDINGLGWTNAAISIILDVWMLFVPLWQVLQLKMSWKKKASVCLMFFVASFVTAMSIVRLQSLINFANSQNPTWDQAAVSQWSTIEINVGIVCACLPALRMILVRAFPTVLGSSAASSNYYGNGKSNGMGRSGNASGIGRSRTADPSDYGHGHPRNRNNAITYTKTFEVQHGDNDEEQLVHMDDLSSKGAKVRSSNSSEVSFNGAISPLPIKPTMPR